MAPVAETLARRGRVEHRLLLTGQHPALADHFAGAGGPVTQLAPDRAQRAPARLRESLHARIWRHLRAEPADLVLVHGDTTSAFAGALAARDCGLPVGHVEAGLRSFDLDRPWPEEGNRVAIDALSALLFAPSETAARNLAGDWRVRGDIHLTGNSGIDALLRAAAGVAGHDRAPGGRRTILVTCHRKENQGPAAEPICAALERIVRTLPVEIVLPLHVNPLVRAGLEARLSGLPHIRLVEPLDYPAMVALMVRSWIILTDSGGLQEEGPALGKPVLVLRSVTERPEAVEAGGVRIVGNDPDRIVAAVAGLLADPAEAERMSRPSFPFGDGKASPRIARAVEQWLGAGRPLRATRVRPPV